MNRDEALALLNAKLDNYRTLSYAHLAAKIGDEEIAEVIGPSGTAYQVEILVTWDSKPNGDIRVLGSIDDDTLRGAFKAVCNDFIVGPDGQEK